MPAAAVLPAASEEALRFEGRKALLAVLAGFCCNMRCVLSITAQQRRVHRFHLCHVNAALCSYLLVTVEQLG